MCPPPAQKAGGTHSPNDEGGGGSIFWKTPDIGLASYSIISKGERHEVSFLLNLKDTRPVTNLKDIGEKLQGDNYVSKFLMTKNAVVLSL